MTLELKILTLNCWGIPFVSSDRKQRFSAIATVLKDKDYDFVCLQEVWSRSDYNFLIDKTKSKLPYSHYFYSGVFGSGICVLSKYQFQEVFFHQWSLNGYVHKFQHGDWFGGKGVALINIRIKNCNIKLYSAHLHAEYNKTCDEYKAHRVLQAFDTAQFIRMTGNNADFIILAGDLNTEPDDIAYRVLTTITGLVDSFTLEKNNAEDLYTNERYQNSYTEEKLIREKFPGVRIDYVMFLASKLYTCNLLKYEHPFPERVPGKMFSYSDHEGVAVSLRLTPSAQTRSDDPCRETFKNVLKEANLILNNAITDLTYQKAFYMLTSITLFSLLLFTFFIEAPFDFKICYFIFRLFICVLLFFTLVMGTGWNNIEYNSLLATKLSMEYCITQTKNKENKLTIF